MKHFIAITIISFALIVGGCGNRLEKDNHAGHDHETEAHDDHNHAEDDHAEARASAAHSDEIIFTPAQAAKTDFALYKVEPVTFNEIIRASGQILYAQGDEASVTATVGGIVSLGTAKIAEGTAVSKGQTLFYISSKNIAQGDVVARTQSAYTQAKAAYERAQELIGDKIISQTEFEQTRLNYENARTAYEALAANSSAKGTGITAPIGGYITGIAVREGDYVEVGQALASVSQNRRLTLRADVPEKYYNALHGVTSANFRTSYDDRVHTLKELNGRLLSTRKASGAGSYYIPVTFEFDNRGEIVPGSFVDVYLIGSPKAGATVVPLTALTEEMGYYFVYVQIDEEGYRKQEVTIGANDGKNVQILSGLSGGETIVSRGAYQVKMAAMSGTAIPHGHSH